MSNIPSYFSHLKKSAGLPAPTPGNLSRNIPPFFSAALQPGTVRNIGDSLDNGRTNDRPHSCPIHPRALLSEVISSLLTITTLPMFRNPLQPEAAY